MCLKLLAVYISIRRDGLATCDQLVQKGSLIEMAIFEVKDPKHGVVLIQGPAPVIQQFFRQYGHPKRDDFSALLPDRAREVLCIVLIYTFVLYFPVGLVTALWIDPNVQYLWLAYELYAILVLHIVRILGWQGCGRTEEHVARLLRVGHEIWIRSSDGRTVAATLVTNSVPNMATGMLKAQEIVTQLVTSTISLPLPQP